MKRGDVVLVAVRGPYSGKPRPAVVVQSDLFNSTHGSLTVCPLTSCLVDAPLIRPAVAPGKGNGLSKPSQAMVDKLFSAPTERVSERIGALDTVTLRRIDEALRRWLGL